MKYIYFSKDLRVGTNMFLSYCTIKTQNKVVMYKNVRTHLFLCSPPSNQLDDVYYAIASVKIFILVFLGNFSAQNASEKN